MILDKLFLKYEGGGGELPSKSPALIRLSDLLKSCSERFCKIYKETSAIESYSKVTGLGARRRLLLDEIITIKLFLLTRVKELSL